MIKICFLNLIFVIVVFFACCSSDTGSDINDNGRITNGSLIYKFKRPKSADTFKDLFNYIYFQGDTLCFSFDIENYNKRNIIVLYKDSFGKITFKSERVDFYKNRISGFSLLGIVLEKFYYDKLNLKIDYSLITDRKIPFLILLKDKSTGLTLKSAEGKFRLDFTQ